MADLATVVDVESRWRPLNPQEVTNAAQWLADASASLRVQVPGLDEAITLDDDMGDLATHTVAMAVVRVLRGRDPRDPADYSGIFFTKAELSALNGGISSAGAFTITLPTDVGYRTGTLLESFGWNV